MADSAQAADPTLDQTKTAPPPPPASGTSKEKGPISAVSESFTESKVAGEIADKEGDEYWKAYGREIELEKELGELGAENSVEPQVTLPREIAEAHGIKPTITEETSFHDATGGFSVSGVSLSDSQLTTGKKQPIDRSFRWMVEWFIYELLKAHFLVKFAKGEISREKS